MIQDDFAGIYKTISEADGIVWISAVYWSEMTECFKAFFDRLRRCDAAHNHFLAQKRCILAACAGGTGERNAGVPAADGKRTGSYGNAHL